MNQNIQLDNPSHFNNKREKVKAEKALEKAKKIKRKVIFLPRGISGEHLQKSENPNLQRTKRGIDKEEVLKLHNEGKTPPQIAKALRVSPQAIYYHLGNLKGNELE